MTETNAKQHSSERKQAAFIPKELNFTVVLPDQGDHPRPSLFKPVCQLAHEEFSVFAGYRGGQCSRPLLWRNLPVTVMQRRRRVERGPAWLQQMAEISSNSHHVINNSTPTLLLTLSLKRR